MALVSRRCFRSVNRFIVVVVLTLFAPRPAPVLAQSCSLPPDPSVYVGHIVVIMMENRSFDHLAGWTTGSQNHTYYVNPKDLMSQHCITYPLNRPVPDPPPPDFCKPSFTPPTYVGTANFADPPHGIGEMGSDYNGGDNKGWLKGGVSDPTLYGIGYYDRDDGGLPFLTRLLTNTADVGQSVLLPRYFGSMLAQTNPNRIYEHTATTDRWDNDHGCQSDGVSVMCDTSNPPNTQISELNTIWDLLASRGVSAGWYQQERCCEWLQTFWPRLVGSVMKGHDLPEFEAAAKSGQLPMVSFLDGIRYHPDTIDVDQGENISLVSDPWLSQMIHDIADGPLRANTLIVITFDENGGFFDSFVPPPVQSVQPYIDTLAGQNGGVPPDPNTGRVPLGFRVPTFIVSPYGGLSDPAFVFDHSSILKMIEWVFTGGTPITTENWPQARAHRDRSPDITNLACALNFPSGNFLLNAGFELPAAPVPAGSSGAGSDASASLAAGLPRWISSGSTPALVDTTHPHSGRQDAVCTTNGASCGIYQDVVAPRTGLHAYRVSFYAAASMIPTPKTDGRVGATGSGTVSASVVGDGTYHQYSMTVSAVGGTPIRVWMTAGPQSGWVSIDDVTLAPQ